eukprot:scpid22612/ scgid12407/ 
MSGAATRGPHRTGAGLAAGLVSAATTLLLVLLAFCSSQGECAYSIPYVCDGINPLDSHGIKTESKALNRRIVAEASLGEKLADPELEMVHIYCILNVNNVTYVPGYCPGSGRKAAYELKDGSGETLPLAFVYGRNADYTETFLDIFAPTRYYSLSSLTKKVAWKAEDGQTLNFSLATDRRSQDCWQQSTSDQRLSFILRLVNRTLTSSWRRVTRGQWLPGNIYTRETSEKRKGLGWPYPYGFIHRYTKCDNAYLPDDIEYDDSSLLNFSMCSHWKPVERGARAENDLWRGVNYACLPVIYVLAIYIIFCVVFPGRIEQWLNGDENFKSGPKRTLDTDDDKPDFPNEDFMPTFDGTYPRALSVLYLASEKKKHTRCLNCCGWICMLVIPVSLVIATLAFAIWINIGEGLEHGQAYDTIRPLLFDCGLSRRSFSITVQASFVLLICIAFAFRHLVKADIPALGQFWWFAHCFKYLRYIAVPMAAVALFGVVNVPSFLLNILVIFTFILIGAAINYTYYLLGFVVIVAVGLFEVFNVGRFNETLGADIALYKRACDRAYAELHSLAGSQCAQEMLRVFAEQAGPQGVGKQATRVMGDAELWIPRGPTKLTALTRVIYAMNALIRPPNDGRLDSTIHQQHEDDIVMEMDFSDGTHPGDVLVESRTQPYIPITTVQSEASPPLERCLSPNMRRRIKSGLVKKGDRMTEEQAREIQETEDKILESLKSFVFRIDHLRGKVFLLLCARHGTVLGLPQKITTKLYQRVYKKLIKVISNRLFAFSLRATALFVLFLLVLGSIHVALINIGKLAHTQAVAGLFVPVLVGLKPILSRLLNLLPNTDAQREEDQLVADAKRMMLLLLQHEMAKENREWMESNEVDGEVRSGPSSEPQSTDPEQNTGHNSSTLNAAPSKTPESQSKLTSSAVKDQHRAGLSHPTANGRPAELTMTPARYCQTTPEVHVNDPANGGEMLPSSASQPGKLPAASAPSAMDRKSQSKTTPSAVKNHNRADAFELKAIPEIEQGLPAMKQSQDTNGRHQKPASLAISTAEPPATSAAATSASGKSPTDAKQTQTDSDVDTAV